MTIDMPTNEDSCEPLSEEGAARLAHAIERFWQTQGKAVHCTVEKIVLGSRDVVYGIRSDLALTGGTQTQGGR
jgi:hypothetical protein